MSNALVQRRLAAILVADVVGYSRLVEKDEVGTLSASKLFIGEVIDPLLALNHGRVVKLMGDGALAEFGSVVDAVACAVALQKGIAENEGDGAPERRLVFRIGINLGDVVVDGDDLLGDGVNIAARLEQICPPGAVMVSGTAYDQLQGKIDLPIEFAGERHVKNMDRPIRTYQLRPDANTPTHARVRRLPASRRITTAVVLLFGCLAAGWWLWPSKPAFASQPSIAVLPFANLGDDEANGRLTDGITEDIITDLAHFPKFEVVVRNSTAVYKNKPVDIRQIGTDFRVKYVLKGSLQRLGDHIRATTAQLIDAASGNHIWSERWDRPAEDVFAVQTEMTEQVTTRLGNGTGLIQEAGRKAAKRKRPENRMRTNSTFWERRSWSRSPRRASTMPFAF